MKYRGCNRLSNQKTLINNSLNYNKYSHYKTPSNSINHKITLNYNRNNNKLKINNNRSIIKTYKFNRNNNK